MFIGPVERLSENELPCISTIANIKPVARCRTMWRGSLMYLCAGGAAVHATDDQVEIVLQIVPQCCQMLRDCLPVESPKQVQAVDKDNGLK